MTEGVTEGASGDASDDVSGDASDGVSPDGWLIDAADPLLTDEALARIADDSRPDRLAWNSFRTLDLWATDVWVPALLEAVGGEDDRLSGLDWTAARAVPWGAGLAGSEVCDVVLDGPEAYVVVVCSAVENPPVEQVRAAAVAALDGSLHGGREAGLVVVLPPGGTDADGLLAQATSLELHEDQTAAGLLAGAMGVIEWNALGRLALDLIEEGDPDTAPTAQVHELITELQKRFPGLEV